MGLNYNVLNLIINTLQGLKDDMFLEDYFGWLHSKTEFKLPFGDEESFKRRFQAWQEEYQKYLGYFENEITQVVSTHNQVSINTYFERIKQWVEYFSETSIEELTSILIEYNIRKQAEFEDNLEYVSKRYHDEENRRCHENLEEYETELYLEPLGIFSGKPPQKVWVTNHKYYCIEDLPEVVDLELVNHYFTFLLQMFGKFEKAVNHHLSLYGQGKYVASTSSIIINNPTTLIQEPPSKNSHRDKIYCNLTVTQLIYLFKVLSNLKPKIFELATDAELHRFIANNFVTKRTQFDGISIKAIRQKFSEEDPESAKFWMKHFSTMFNETKKYH